MKNEHRSRSTAWLLIIGALLLTVAVTRWAVLASGEPTSYRAPSVTFRGTIASLYPDGTGGCIRAAEGQGLTTADDANCGLMFLVPGASSLAVGRSVEATSIDSETTDGEALQGYIIGPLTP